ncbi:MAG: glutamate--tRNA ligase [Myxococcales bacterium]|nr:glutamate--tRNA ligase [Myxococcales bacterium]MCB9755517.1 glutamate--tRNA ligase [Myxococcales bacterium]
MDGMKPPRVRIAPSPTGDPHVGTAYIGLFNYVFARKHGGAFIVRIEDTDRARSTEGSEEAIFAALRWLGLEWDEGPDIGGPFGPYRQSERGPIYSEHVDLLLATGKAYRCFATKEELEAMRETQKAEQRPTAYDGRYRDYDRAQAEARARAGEPHVVRLKVPRDGETVFQDGLRGEVRFENRLIDDAVIMKSDGFPTYHLANVVDDHLMGITHVIRGEEWITSTPKHILLYDAFGWTPPEFYHLGLLRNADRSKLSKRRNPVSIDHYRELGILPQTFLNFLATLGFSIADDRDRFTLDEMIEKFDWSRVSVGGPVFDGRKLEAFNGDDIRGLSLDEFVEQLQSRVLAPARLRELAALVHERINRLDDFVPYASFFFGGALDYTPVLAKFSIKKRTRAEVLDVLTEFMQGIERDPDARGFTAEGLERFSRTFCEQTGWKTRDIFGLLRVVVTGRTAAPGLFETMAAVGKDRVRLRIRDALRVISELPEEAPAVAAPPQPAKPKKDKKDKKKKDRRPPEAPSRGAEQPVSQDKSSET